MNAKRIIQFADHAVNAFVAIFCIVCLLYGGYALWDNMQIDKQADPTLYKTYRPAKDDLSFQELRKLNAEVFGWISIPHTAIDYPLVQGENNTKYVNTDPKGDFALSGSIFLDCHNAKDFSDMNSIIYGHHMEKAAMFGQLDDFASEKYFQKHAKGRLYYQAQWHDVEFFAFLYADAYDEVLYDTELSLKEQQAYLSYVKQQAHIFKDIDFKENEHYVTLSTCATDTTNGRYLLIGRIKHA